MRTDIYVDNKLNFDLWRQHIKSFSLSTVNYSVLWLQRTKMTNKEINEHQRIINKDKIDDFAKWFLAGA